MTTKDLSLTHLIKPSKLNQASPLILMLHGYGSDEKDLFAFANYLPDNYTVISVRAPYPMQPMGNAWYAINFDADANKFSDTKQAIESREKIKKFISEAIDAYHINPKEVTLFGFSQGTILSFATALTYPYLIKNIIGLSGYIDKNMIDLADKEALKHLRVFSSHGSADQVIPVEWARKTPDILKSLSIDCEFKEFPVGHGVNQDNFQAVLDWLKRH
ncbi:MAG: phospholipase [Bacteroidetes bacterium]|jgi:phospholipase/carboxylesterase|nr:phospholipase [Bacteroidota bacterium]